MPRSSLRAGIAVAAVFTALAQQASPPVSFSGMVVNTVTGAPVPFVRVTLLPEGSEVQTDPTGTFRFEQVAVGDHIVRANKTGFDPAETHEYGYSVLLKGSLDSFTVGVTPLSSIRGRITDGDGEPVDGATVLVVQSKVEAGRRQNKVLRVITSDDRGEYRASLLPAGEYLVQVSGQSSQTPYYKGVRELPVTTEGFSPVYFGGSSDAAGATPVRLAAGADTRADFHVTLRPGHNIRGSIRNLKQHSKAELQLSRGEEDLGVTRSSLELSTGEFEIRGVMDGAYHLRVYQPNEQGEILFAEQDVAVSGRDIDGLALTLVPPPTVKGKLHIEGPSTDGHSQGVVLSAKLDPQDLFLPARAGNGPRFSSDVTDGAFEIPSVLPGKYWIQFETGTRYITFARAGEKDILASQEVVVSDGGTPELDIVLRTDGGSVAGSVAVDQKDIPVLVLLVPESCDRPVTAMEALGENFSFRGVAPGNYRLHVLKKSSQPEYGSPTMMSALARSGTPVEVKAGELTSVPKQKLTEAHR